MARSDRISPKIMASFWTESTSRGRRDDSAAIYDVGRATTRPSTISTCFLCTPTNKRSYHGQKRFGFCLVFSLFIFMLLCVDVLLYFVLLRWDFYFILNFIWHFVWGHETPKTPILRCHKALPKFAYLVFISFVFSSATNCGFVLPSMRKSWLLLHQKLG